MPVFPPSLPPGAGVLPVLSETFISRGLAVLKMVLFSANLALEIITREGWVMGQVTGYPS